jgi:methylenetetrahydrofolate reductase (NADPH)
LKVNNKFSKSDYILGLESLKSLPKGKVSFEFFPPKNDDMEKTLWETITRLEPLNPQFVSVTYGAGGSTRERTHQTVARIVKETSLKPAAHLTCVAASKQEVNDVAKQYWDAGVRHIVALRGDAPDGGSYTPHPQGYEYSCDLVAGLKNIADFEISVAAFPEVHPEAISADTDLDYLKRKIDAGATRAITQYFMSAETYLRFLERARAKNINVPILPGILMINNFNQFLKFNQRCGASVPKWIFDLLNGTDETPQQRDFISLAITLELCRKLRSEGIEDLHFYTLNRAAQVETICRVLG